MLAERHGDYEDWPARQPLSANTRRAYATRAGQSLGHRASVPAEEYGDPLGDAHARDYAARDFKAHLKTVSEAKPSSANLTLAAIDNFYRFVGLGRPRVRRGEPTKAAPRALSPGY